MTPAPVAEGVWVREVALGDYDVRGVVIAGRTGAVVWDTLSHPRDMAGYDALVGGRSLSIVYSHADWDHVWGTAGLPHHDALIVGHRACLERFASDVPATLDEKRRAEPGRWEEVALVPPSTVFDEHHVIDLGGLTLHLSHLPGHTRDCIVGLVPERGLLLMGDTVETPFPVVPNDSPLDTWLRHLARWSGDPRVDMVIPAHGPMGGVEIVRRTLAYLRGLLDGTPVEVPAALTAFYRETHDANLKWRPAPG